MMKRLWLVAGVLAAGCVDQHAADQARCSQYGFSAGSDAYAHCMMVNGLRRQDQDAANLRATQARIDADNARRSAEFHQQMIQPPAASPTPNRDPFHVPGGLQTPAPTD